MLWTTKLEHQLTTHRDTFERNKSKVSLCSKQIKSLHGNIVCQSINQSINQSISQSISQSVSQSINHLMKLNKTLTKRKVNNDVKTNIRELGEISLKLRMSLYNIRKMKQD